MWLAFWIGVAVIAFFVLLLFACYLQRWDADKGPELLPMDESILSYEADSSLSPEAKSLIDINKVKVSLQDKDRSLLEKGYPICREGMCIYDSQTVLPHLRHYIPPRVKSVNRKHKIPALLFQSFNHSVLHEDYYKVISHTLRLNPHYEYHFHDTLSCQKLLRDNFEPNVLQAYNDLIPGAYRCDLWRLCALYVHGGVYMDLKLCPYLPFDDMFDVDTDIILSVERFGIEYPEESIFNGFLAASPRHPLLYSYIQEIVRRVESRGYFQNPWSITGPRVLSQVVIKELKCHWPPTSGNYGKHGKVNFCTCQWYGTRSVYVGEKQAIKLRTQATDGKERFATLSGAPSYNQLWKERKVYATPYPRKPTV